MDDELILFETVIDRHRPTSTGQLTAMRRRPWGQASREVWPFATARHDLFHSSHGSHARRRAWTCRAGDAVEMLSDEQSGGRKWYVSTEENSLGVLFCSSGRLQGPLTVGAAPDPDQRWNAKGARR